MSEATNGPWGIEKTSCTNWIGPLRRDGKVNEIVVSTDRDDSLKPEVIEVNDANARLISAAPELLEACKMARSVMAEKYNAKECRAIDKAISKALLGRIEDE